MSGLIDRIGLKPAAKPKMGKSSAEERFTLMLVSSRGRSHSLGFNIRTVKMVAWTALVAAAVLLVFFTSYRAISKELAELRYMREVAESQKEQIRSLQEQYTFLEERVREAELVESQIKDLLGQEGLLPQGYISGDAAIVSLSRTSLTAASRDGGLVSRLSSAAEIGRALYALTSSANTLAEDAASIEARFKDLHEVSKEIVAKARATPSTKPVAGRISSSFGWRRSPFNSHAKDYHPGVDIAAGMWEPIVATADGVVTFSGYKYGYGWTIVIEHGYGYTTLYAHCCRLKAGYGKRIRRGDVIAYVGQSGSATGPHLHYEVQVSGRPVDPEMYFTNEVLEVDNSVR